MVVPEARPEVASHGGIGVANAVLGALCFATGLALRDLSERRKAREARGSEPNFWGANVLRRLGLCCRAVGVVSQVAGDALLPVCTQAPFRALAVFFRGLISDAAGGGREAAAGGGGGRAAYAKLEKAPSWEAEDGEFGLPADGAADVEAAPVAAGAARYAGPLLAAVGPFVALVGAPLDDVGGLSVVDVRILVFGPPAVAYTALSALLLLGLRKAARDRPRNASVLLAYAVLGAAFGSAWVHVVVKSLVEVFLYYGSDALDLLSEPTVLAAAVTVPVLADLRRRFYKKGSDHFDEAVFAPLVAALSVATNVVCGVFYFDDLGLLGSGASPVLAPNTPMEARDRASPARVAAFFVGAGLAVAGVLLTLPPAERGAVAFGGGRDRSVRGGVDDPTDDEITTDLYGALALPGGCIGDDPVMGPGRRPKESKREWSCGNSARAGSRDPPAVVHMNDMGAHLPQSGGAAWETAAAEAMNRGTVFAASLAMDADL